MSPLQAMERSYGALRTMLREGSLVPGQRLEAMRLADEIGVSMTPVRDALNRLVGEQLVEANAGDGFHVPRMSEADLRDLYEWHSALVIMAVSTARAHPRTDDLEAALGVASAAEAASIGFELIAEASANRELRLAIRNAADRLHAYRQIEQVALAASPDELVPVLTPGAGQRPAIRRYHLARMRAVPELLAVRAGRK